MGGFHAGRQIGKSEAAVAKAGVYMARTLTRESTGINGIDEIIDGIRSGDNVVWQVDSIDDYLSFARPFIDRAIKDGNGIVYMRFAQHKPVIEGIVTVVDIEDDEMRLLADIVTQKVICFSALKMDQ